MLHAEKVGNGGWFSERTISWLVIVTTHTALIVHGGCVHSAVDARLVSSVVSGLRALQMVRSVQHSDVERPLYWG